MTTVLVVGALEPLRSRLFAALERAGHVAIGAVDARAALDLAATRTPDLVICADQMISVDEVVGLASRIPDRAQAMREHEDDVDFAMSVARVGVSPCYLDSRRAGPVRPCVRRRSGHVSCEAFSKQQLISRVRAALGR
jgi:DNA-binding NarL/FixJ family response regulator